MERLYAIVDLTLSRSAKETINLTVTSLRSRDHSNPAHRDAIDGDHELSLEETKTLASRLKAVPTAKSNTVIDVAGIELSTVGHSAAARGRNPNTARLWFVDYTPMRFMLSADDAEALSDLLILLTKQWPPRNPVYIQLDLVIDHLKGELWGKEQDQAVLDAVSFKD